MIFGDAITTSDIVLITTAICGVITAIGVPLVAVLATYMTFKLHSLQEGQKAAATEVVQGNKDKAEALADVKKTLVTTQAEQSKKIDKVEKGINGEGLGGQLEALIHKVDQHTQQFAQHTELFADHIKNDDQQFEAVKQLVSQKADRIGQQIAKKTIIKPLDDHTTDQAFTPGNPLDQYPPHKEPIK